MMTRLSLRNLDERAPPAIPALSFPEQLALWAMRMWRAWPGGGATIRAEICRACGPAAGARAHAGLDGLLSVLLRMAQRTIELRPLAAPDVSGDEDALLALIAAAQCGDRRHAEALARALVREPARPLLLDTATGLGAALASGAQRLPPRYALPRGGEAIH